MLLMVNGDFTWKHDFELLASLKRRCVGIAALTNYLLGNICALCIAVVSIHVGIDQWIELVECLLRMICAAAHQQIDKHLVKILVFGIETSGQLADGTNELVAGHRLDGLLDLVQHRLVLVIGEPECYNPINCGAREPTIQLAIDNIMRDSRAQMLREIIFDAPQLLFVQLGKSIQVDGANLAITIGSLAANNCFGQLTILLDDIDERLIFLRLAIVVQALILTICILGDSLVSGLAILILELLKCIPREYIGIFLHKHRLMRFEVVEQLERLIEFMLQCIAQALGIAIQQKFALHSQRRHALQAKLKVCILVHMLQYGLGYLIIATLNIRIRILQQHGDL